MCPPTHHGPDEEDCREHDVEYPHQQSDLLPAHGGRRELPALPDQNQHQNEQPVRHKVAGLRHVVDRPHPNSVLGVDSVVSHDQSYVEELEEQRGGEYESDAVVLVPPWGAHTRVHGKVEYHQGKVDAGEYDIDDHHADQVEGELVNEWVGISCQVRVLVDDVYVIVDGDLCTLRPQARGMCGAVLLTADQEEVVELCFGGDGPEREVAARHEWHPLGLVLAHLPVVAGDHAEKVLSPRDGAAGIWCHAEVEGPRHEVLAGFLCLLLDVVEVFPDRGGNEGQYELLTEGNVARRRPHGRAIRKHLVTFLDPELGEVFQPVVTLVFPGTSYPGGVGGAKERGDQQS